MKAGDLDLADFYEKMVKEYLEQQGYTVRLRIRFFKTGGFSDIDVFAINSVNEKIIVGEVKGPTLGKKQIDQENNDFNNSHLLKKIKELAGDSKYSKYVFCWSVTEETKEYALKKYQITIIQFWEIINQFIGRVKKVREKGKWIYDQTFPNTMLLQMLSFFNKPIKGKKRIDLSNLQN